MKIKVALTASLAMVFASPASGQDLNNGITDYRADMFRSCYSGEDIGALMNAANPMGLLGSIAYVGSVMTPTGVRQGWVRQPLALPIVVSDATDPGITTCSVEFETTANAGFTVLGVGFAAGRADVYRVTVRLVSRQGLAETSEGNTSVKVWLSSQYRGQFQAAIGAAPATATDIFLFDDISAYLVQIERFQRRGAGGFAGIGLFSGNARYQRDETFRGTRLLVTGNPIPLLRANYVTPPVAVAAAPTPTPAAASSSQVSPPIIPVETAVQRLRAAAARND